MMESVSSSSSATISATARGWVTKGDPSLRSCPLWASSAYWKAANSRLVSALGLYCLILCSSAW